MSNKTLALTLPQKVSLWVSSVCLIHCLITPFIILLLPAVSGFFSETLELLLVLSVIPISAIAFFPTWKNHKNKQRLAEFSTGIGLILIAQFLLHFFGHDAFAIIMLETIVMIAGVGLVAYATYRNRRHTHHCANPHHVHA